MFNPDLWTILEKRIQDEVEAHEGMEGDEISAVPVIKPRRRIGGKWPEGINVEWHEKPTERTIMRPLKDRMELVVVRIEGDRLCPMNTSHIRKYMEQGPYRWLYYRPEVLQVEAKMTDEQGAMVKTFGTTLHNCKKIKSCLLYTSPSPRDKRQSRMPSSA